MSLVNSSKIMWLSVEYRYLQAEKQIQITLKMSNEFLHSGLKTSDSCSTTQLTLYTLYSIQYTYIHILYCI